MCQGFWLSGNGVAVGRIWAPVSRVPVRAARALVLRRGVRRRVASCLCGWVCFLVPGHVLCVSTFFMSVRLSMVLCIGAQTPSMCVYGHVTLVHPGFWLGASWVDAAAHEV